jgi:hypothetical protein
MWPSITKPIGSRITNYKLQKKIIFNFFFSGDHSSLFNTHNYVKKLVYQSYFTEFIGISLIANS